LLAAGRKEETDGLAVQNAVVGKKRKTARGESWKKKKPLHLRTNNEMGKRGVFGGKNAVVGGGGGEVVRCQQG